MEMFQNEENSKSSIHFDEEDSIEKEEAKEEYPSLPNIIENHCDISKDFPVTESIHIANEKLLSSFILDKSIPSHSIQYIIREKGEVKD
jgi:hypothetical protein